MPNAKQPTRRGVLKAGAVLLTLPALEARLSDSAPEVRANVAFAIGQLALEDGGLALLGSLMQEEDPEVQIGRAHV